MLGHKRSLKNFQKIFSDDSSIKLEINRKNFRNSPNIQKVNNVFINNQGVKKEIKKEN
jgi:hypothetical protein